MQPINQFIREMAETTLFAVPSSVVTPMTMCTRPAAGCGDDGVVMGDSSHTAIAGAVKTPWSAYPSNFLVDRASSKHSICNIYNGGGLLTRVEARPS